MIAGHPFAPPFNDARAARSASGSPTTTQRQPIEVLSRSAMFSLTAARLRSRVTKTSARRRASDAWSASNVSLSDPLGDISGDDTAVRRVP
jgi:hypothetical protein